MLLQLFCSGPKRLIDFQKLQHAFKGLLSLKLNYSLSFMISKFMLSLLKMKKWVCFCIMCAVFWLVITVAAAIVMGVVWTISCSKQNDIQIISMPTATYGDDTTALLNRLASTTKQRRYHSSTISNQLSTVKSSNASISYFINTSRKETTTQFIETIKVKNYKCY